MLIRYIEVFLFLRWWHRGPYRLPLLALISSTFFLWRWQQSPLRDFHHPQGFQKPPQQRPFVEFRRYFVLQHFAMFWHANVFSRNLSQSFPEALARLCSGFLPRFVFLWLLFRRALCQRRPRRRVGCSGQAVPCLLLRRFQQAVLRRCDWCMLMDVDVCWCM